MGQRGKCVGKIVKESNDLSSTLLKNIIIKPVKQKKITCKKKKLLISIFNDLNGVIFLVIEQRRKLSKSRKKKCIEIFYSAVWKARVKFFSLSFGTNELKSKASGKNRWTRAQKAIPSHQDDEKFSMLTP